MFANFPCGTSRCRATLLPFCRTFPGFSWGRWKLRSGKHGQKTTWNMAIEIVDLPSYKMVIFHSYVNVYQRVRCSLSFCRLRCLWNSMNIFSVVKCIETEKNHNRCLNQAGSKLKPWASVQKPRFFSWASQAWRLSPSCLSQLEGYPEKDSYDFFLGGYLPIGGYLKNSLLNGGNKILEQITIVGIPHFVL